MEKFEKVCVNIVRQSGQLRVSYRSQETVMGKAHKAETRSEARGRPRDSEAV